jgi:hypothetical protein
LYALAIYFLASFLIYLTPSPLSFEGEGGGFWWGGYASLKLSFSLFSVLSWEEIWGGASK